MDRDRFVLAAFAAFGCVLASFVTLGFGRLLVGYRTALLLAAPFGLLAFTLVLALTALSVWWFVTEKTGRGAAAVGGGRDEAE
jgi:hypothetical protein